jgi:hypothetical protein
LTCSRIALTEPALVAGLEPGDELQVLINRAHYTLRTDLLLQDAQLGVAFS